jgi:hypothetical protein
VKFATRLDSPACIDLFDKEIELREKGNSQSLYLEVMCRTDKRLLRYKLEIKLFSKVVPLVELKGGAPQPLSDEQQAELDKVKEDYQKY